MLVNPPSQYAVQGGTGNSDNTNELGTHIAISCGREGNNFPNNYETGVDFVVITAVGGEIISVDTAALVIAGLTTSVIWIVPTLVTVTGIGVTLYKLRK